MLQVPPLWEVKVQQVPPLWEVKVLQVPPLWEVKVQQQVSWAAAMRV